MDLLAGGSNGNNQIWIENHPTEGWVPGRVESLAPNGKYVVVDDDGTTFEVAQDKARPVDQACMRGVDDLLSLGDFNEGALLHNIRVRYFKDEIYTGIGGPILISVNPFANLPALYTEARQKYHRDQGAAAASGQDVHIPPHLFSVADNSFVSMLSDQSNQSIIISGESGAGKTEATKRVLAYFATVQTMQCGAMKDPNEMTIQDQILRANPILEAFGNAKTVRNDNSSRFGKFIDIEFDKSGKLQSARISNYLLEKCRIIQQQPEERGYHIFYHLCAGAQGLAINSTLRLQDASEHAYVQQCCEVSGVDDNEMFDEMVDCMLSLGFTTEERDSIFKIVAGVLHLGDLDFEEHANSADGCKIRDSEKASNLCEMFDVQLKDFSKVFQFRTLEDPFTHKIIDMPHDATSSSNTRHSMAKVAYSRLFDWLVWRINQSTLGAKGGASAKNKKIGILDIYGFEVFEWNSFEQLCINFANEKLQQHFNAHMFTLEQQVYTEEGIAWSHIQFQDNREIIECLERKPLGVFCILDSECLMPNATDQTCLSKIYNSFKTSKIVFKPSRFASTNFAVAHYAGEVIYDVISFLEKNTDKLHADVVNLLKNSSMPLLKTLFSDPKFAPDAQNAKKPAPKAEGRSTGGGGRAKQNVTVGMMFRMQLDQLVEDLNKTHPRYIRCIKPNSKKSAHLFDSKDVQRQLRCAGMLESIRIRRAGYSVRRPFKEFYSRFRVLCPSISPSGHEPDFKELSRRILIEMEGKLKKDGEKIADKMWQVGRSKVFMKEDFQQMLEKRIGDAVKGYVRTIQTRWRGAKCRKRFLAMKKNVFFVQSACQTILAVTKFQELRRRREACVALQAGLRAVAQRVDFVKRRNASVMIQKVCRGWLSRRKIGKLKGKMAAERIQRMREEEERQKQLVIAQKESEEKEKALAEMQKQLAIERERAQEEAQRQLEKQKAQALETNREEERARAEQERLQREKQQQEFLELRKENARLQGQLDCQQADAGSRVNDEEVEHLRLQLQDMRREKVRLEVELETETSSLRQDKMTADMKNHQQQVELDSLKAQVEENELVLAELNKLKLDHDEMQVTLQKAQAQKSALEDRLKESGTARTELRDLRMENMRLQGDLETAQMKEQAIRQKLKNSDNLSSELTQKQQQVITMEAELEMSRKQVAQLKDQMSTMRKGDSVNRSASLDQLRSELMARLDTKSPSQTSLAEVPAPPPPEEDQPYDRKTILNQRDMFEKLRQQFNNVQTESKDIPEEEPDKPDNAREMELEDEVRKAKRENAELNMKVKSLQDEVDEKLRESSSFMERNGYLNAEIQDLQFQLEQQGVETQRLVDQNAVLEEKLLLTEADVATQRRRLQGAEERLLGAEQDHQSSQMKIARLEEEKETGDLRAQQLQRKVSEHLDHARQLEAKLEEQSELRERFQKMAESSERGRVEKASSAHSMELEIERLNGELIDAQEENVKIKQLFSELNDVENKRNSEEQEREIDKWKNRASHYEREYNQSKQLNSEMQKVMSQMTQAVSERNDESSDISRNNRALAKNFETQKQELRIARMEKEDLQSKLDTLQSTGNYYQDKYKEASVELRTMKQEHSTATAVAAKLRARVESVQKENEDLKAQISRRSLESRSNTDDSGRIERYEMHVKDLQQKLHKKDEEVEQSQAWFAKSQAVNDCLNTLLVIEAEQTALYASSVQVEDEDVQSQLNAKKSKAQHVIGRLNEIMTEPNEDDAFRAGLSSPVANLPSYEFAA